MIHEKATEEIREIAALFSLGVLTQHEAQSFQTHLHEGCPVCEAEYHRFRHIAAEIGLSANEVPAPDYICELILARIDREMPEEAAEAETDTETEPEKEPEKEPEIAREPEKVVPKPSAKPVLTQPPAERPTVFPWILAAIFAVIAVITFFAYRSQQSEISRLNRENASLETDYKDLEALYDIQKGRRGELEQIISAVSKPETRILHLAGMSPAPTASGAMLWDAQKNRCLVFGYMPPVPQGKAYQLWFMTPSANIPSGLLKPDPSGRIYEEFPVPADISSMTMVITREPESGSKVPTTPYYAIGRND